jgi:hypothetical protein
VLGLWVNIKSFWHLKLHFSQLLQNRSNIVHNSSFENPIMYSTVHWDLLMKQTNLNIQVGINVTFTETWTSLEDLHMLKLITVYHTIIYEVKGEKFSCAKFSKTFNILYCISLKKAFC